jgi:hypothetical protein
MDLTTPPLPLTRRQRIIFIVIAAAIAATRFLAIARTLWEWDETLFLLGMRDYDVAQHQPHPPGFPLFIALGKLIALVTPSDFRALQTIAVVASLLVFPAVFFLAREFRFRFEVCAAAGALFAFFPNVWYFGGTAFSDVPSIVMATFAAALLLRGVRDRKSYFLGTLILALAIGIRPQNLLIGLFPGILATWRRGWRDALLALLLGIVIAGAAFGGAIYATGAFERYMTAVREHGDYIARVDSFRSPERPPLWRILDRFFVKQYQSPPLSFLTTLFVIASIVGAARSRDPRPLYAFLTFGPFAIMAWLMLDRFSISRFSIGYAPLFAILAADGIARVGRGNARAIAAIAGAMTLAFFIWTVPVFGPIRSQVSPTVRAVEAVKRGLDPARDRLYVGHSLTRFVDYLAPGFPFIRVIDDRAVPLSSSANAWLLAEVTEARPPGHYFKRERGRLWNIARHHYFDIVLTRIGERGEFLDGWYAAEGGGVEEWRWMGGRSVTKLPAATGDMLLRLHFTVPAELVAQRAEIAITLNGKELDRFSAEVFVRRDYRVQPAANGAANILELAISRTLRPADDDRDLGLKLQFLGWGAR